MATPIEQFLAAAATDGEERLSLFTSSGIPADVLNTCAALISEYERSDEYDPRIVVVVIASVLRDAFAT